MRRTINLPGEDVLPPGSLRSLATALHELYVGAGRPGVGKISKTINSDDQYPGTISDERVRQLLRGEGGMPEWLRYLSVVLYLTDRHTPALDRDEQEVRFKQLYDAVFDAVQTGQTAPPEHSISNPAPTAEVLVHHDQMRPVPVMTATGNAGLELFKDSLVAHGGLPVHAIEETAWRLCVELQEASSAIIADLDLPPETLVEVRFMDGTPDTSYGGRPYRPARLRQLGLMLKLSMSQPFRIRAVAGMLPGIATHRDNAQSFIVVDPTHPDVAPLHLHVADLHPGPTDEAKRRIRAWVSGQMNLMFTNAAATARLEREAFGYRDLAP